MRRANTVLILPEWESGVCKLPKPCSGLLKISGGKTETGLAGALTTLDELLTSVIMHKEQRNSPLALSIQGAFPPSPASYLPKVVTQPSFKARGSLGPWNQHWPTQEISQGSFCAVWSMCAFSKTDLCPSLCVCVHGHLQRLEEGVGSLELELQVLGTNSGIQQEQRALSTGERFLQSIFPFERSHLGLNGMVFVFITLFFGLLGRRFWSEKLHKIHHCNCLQIFNSRTSVTFSVPTVHDFFSTNNSFPQLQTW